MSNNISYIDYNSILVVNTAGELRQVNTPFRVIAQGADGTKGKIYEVQEVKHTLEDVLVFIINDTPYYHYHFVLDESVL